MYHRKKKLYSPVTQEQLVESKMPESVTVWLQADDSIEVKSRLECVWDPLSVSFKTVESFRALQKWRVQESHRKRQEKFRRQRVPGLDPAYTSS